MTEYWNINTVDSRYLDFGYWNINTVDSRYLDFGYLEQLLISKKKSGPCLNIEI